MAIINQANLQNYHSIKAQLNHEDKDQCLEKTVNFSVEDFKLDDQKVTEAQIESERAWRAKRVSFETAINANVHNQWYVFYDLRDVCMVEGNEWPLFMFDSFEITARISHLGILSRADLSDTTVNPAEWYIELQKVEMHMFYYTVSEDEVKTLREQAAAMESAGESKFGLSFMTWRL